MSAPLVAAKPNKRTLNSLLAGAVMGCGLLLCIGSTWQECTTDLPPAQCGRGKE